MYALDPGNGSLKWSYLSPGPVYSSPAVGPEGTIYFGVYSSASDTVVALWPQGTRRWGTHLQQPVYSSPAVGPDGTVYVGCMDGTIHALDGATGAFKSGWPYTTLGTVYSSPAVAADGTVFVGSYDGKLYALLPGGALKWAATLGGTVRSSPALGPEGTVYVGVMDGSVRAFDPASGAARGTAWTPYPLYSSPAVAADGTVFIGSADGALYAFTSTLQPRGAPWPYFMWLPVLPCSPAIGCDGTVYIGNEGGSVYAVRGPSGLAQSPWPMFRRNARHTAYDWFPVGGGIEPGQSVFALAGGAYNSVYVGGTFTTAGSVGVGRIAQWSGTAWGALGTGLSDGYASVLCNSGSSLYVAGAFGQAGGAYGPNLGRWSSGWFTQYGPNGPVNALAGAANGDVFVGGQFSAAYGMPVNNLFRIAASGGYYSLGASPSDGVNGPVHALVIDAMGRVYVAGHFTTAGGQSVGNLARWDAQAGWSPLGGGTDGAVAALALRESSPDGPDLYVAGYFKQVKNGGTWSSANGIARWNHASNVLTPLGGGLQTEQLDVNNQWATVAAHGTALALDGSSLYVGGDFTLAGGMRANRVAKAALDTGIWWPVGSGVSEVSAVVDALAVTSDYIYIGGNFTTAGGTVANGIARWRR